MIFIDLNAFCMRSKVRAGNMHIVRWTCNWGRSQNIVIAHIINTNNSHIECCNISVYHSNIDGRWVAYKREMYRNFWKHLGSFVAHLRKIEAALKIYLSPECTMNTCMCQWKNGLCAASWNIYKLNDGMAKIVIHTHGVDSHLFNGKQQCHPRIKPNIECKSANKLFNSFSVEMHTHTHTNKRMVMAYFVAFSMLSHDVKECCECVRVLERRSELKSGRGRKRENENHQQFL